MLQGLLFSFRHRKRLKQERVADELMRRLTEKSVLVVDKGLIRELSVGRKTLYRVIYDLVRRERMFMLSDAMDQMVLMTNSEFNRFMLRRSGKLEYALPALAYTEGEEHLGAAALAVDVSAETPERESVAVVARMIGLSEDAYCDDADSSLFIGATLGGASHQDFWEIPAAILDSSLAGTLLPTIPEPFCQDECIDFDTRELAAIGMDSARISNRSRRTTSIHSQPKEVKDFGVASNLDWFSLENEDSQGLEFPPNRQSLPERRREPWTM